MPQQSNNKMEKAENYLEGRKVLKEVPLTVTSESVLQYKQITPSHVVKLNQCGRKLITYGMYCLK